MTDPIHPASSPWSLRLASWKAILVAAWRETGEDNIGLIASGVAFYGFLAIVPLLGAIVLSYGIVADRATVVHDMTALTAVMPGDAARLVGEQLMNVVQTSDGKKGFGLLVALAFALFGARNGAGAVITALNIAYDEEETRSFVRVNLLALAITAVAVGVAILALVAIAAMGHLTAVLPHAPAAVVVLGKAASYLLLTLAGATGAALLYRYGPARADAPWAWITPGSGLAAMLWLALTIGFGLYVANFGNYNATYGSLGAVVVLLTWLYLSSYILLFGAELNAAVEDHADAAPASSSSSASPQSPSAAAPARADAVPVAGKPRMLVWGAAITGLAMALRKKRRGRGLTLLAATAGTAWLTRTRPAE